MTNKSLEEEVGLRTGEQLKQASHRISGHQGCDDIYEYVILDSAGNEVGSATVIEHMSTRAPFQESRSVQTYRK